MAPKRKGAKKGRKNQKEKQLAEMFENLDDKELVLVNQMWEHCEETCITIDQQYNNILSTVDEKLLSMTLDEVLQLQLPRTPPQSKFKNTFVGTIESKLKCMSDRKLMSASKRTSMRKGIMTSMQRRNLLDSTFKKAPTNSANPKGKRKVLASMQHTVTPQLKRKAPISNTPLAGKPSICKMQKTTNVVTPKFDLRRPIPNLLLRQPKCGEVLMSTTGSPVHNPVRRGHNQHALVLSLGGGKVLNFADDINDIHLDKETKENLLLVQQKLARVLKG